MATQRGTLPLHILKCCACNEFPWSQVFQCMKAHTICDQCHSRVNNCPECNIKLAQETKIQSSMEVVLDTMDFDCPYKEQGCEEKLTRNKMSCHRKRCGYRPSSVQLCNKFGLPCHFSVSRDKTYEAIRHFQDEHEFAIIHDSNEFTVALRSLASSRNLSSPQDRIFSPVIVKSGDEYTCPVFIVVGIVKEKLLRMVSLFFGDYNPSYRCEFEIDKKHLDSVAKLSWTERPRGIWSKDFDLQTAASVKVPLQVLQQYATSNESILVNVTIVRSKENIEAPRTLQSLVVNELNLQQGKSPGNTDTAGVGDITGTAEDWKGGQNPFLIKSVVKSIAKYLSFEELKVCRGLNHLWKKTTNKTFVKLCLPLCLGLSASKKNYANGSNKKMTIPQFMEINSDPNHPHPHAQLLRQYRNFSVSGYDGECIPTFYKFMTVVGPQMTSLEFNYVKVLRNSQDLMDILSSKYTPQLEKLSLCNLEKIGNYQQSDSQMPIDVKENKHFRRLSIAYSPTNIRWLDVLSHYPKLKTLHLTSFPADVLEEIAAGLVTIRKAHEGKLKLTELGILEVHRTGGYKANGEKADDGVNWPTVLDLLKTANLPLEKITLDDCTNHISSALIQHYGENLKSLTLKDYKPQPLALMKALEEMSVENCPDLTFLTKTPNLKSLRLEPNFRHVLPIRFPNSTPKPLLSLAKLDCGVWKECNITEMEQLRLWMPNVQNLEMRLNNANFSWICQHFPNLKELTVWGNDLDDSGVVGDFDGTLAEGSRPNITNLKGLEKFEMAGCAVLNKGLTQKSVFHGFSLMPKLSNLDINVKSAFSITTMRALNRGIKNVKVNVAQKKNKTVKGRHIQKQISTKDTVN